MLSRGGDDSDEIAFSSPSDTRSLCNVPLQDYVPSLRQSESLRSKSAGTRRTEYEMTTVYPLEVQVNRLALEQESGIILYFLQLNLLFDCVTV